MSRPHAMRWGASVLLTCAAACGLLELELDEKSGGYIIRGFHLDD